MEDQVLDRRLLDRAQVESGGQRGGRAAAARGGGERGHQQQRVHPEDQEVQVQRSAPRLGAGSGGGGGRDAAGRAGRCRRRRIPLRARERRRQAPAPQPEAAARPPELGGFPQPRVLVRLARGQLHLRLQPPGSPRLACRRQVGAGCEGKAREDGEGDPMGVTRLGWPPASCSDARCHQSDSRASKAGAGEAAWAVPRHGAGGVGDGDQQGERGRDVSAGQDEQEAAQDPAALVRQAARRQRHEAPEPRKCRGSGRLAGHAPSRDPAQDCLVAGRAPAEVGRTAAVVGGARVPTALRRVCAVAPGWTRLPGGAERVSPRRIGPCGWRCHAPCCRAWDVERNSRAPRAPDARGLVHGLQLLFGEEPGGCGFEESGGFGVCWSETVERGMHRPAPRGGSSARRLSFHVQGRRRSRADRRASLRCVGAAGQERQADAGGGSRVWRLADRNQPRIPQQRRRHGLGQRGRASNGRVLGCSARCSGGDRRVGVVRRGGV
mmetsp:Transcript_60165/g.141989  ORF Transcript_60165/g.141989 Transcript_60165/m.141989 type:complete len:493 (+) Transcript_60165:487-1965(+)